MNTADGSYKLGITELAGITDLENMTGRYVRFFMSPRITNNRLDGLSPKARFIKNSDGILIPADEITGQMVVIYSHMQKMAELDKELGAEGVNQWPRDVGLAVRVRGLGKVNNAFYEGTTDSMLIVPYTNSNTAISINGGILAHEHFHSLFYKLALGKAAAGLHEKELSTVLNIDLEDTLSGRLTPGAQDTELTEKSLNEYYYAAITRGMNEGLADFWGWMYTGDPDFIVQSLPKEKGRTLKVAENISLGSALIEGNIKEKLKSDFQFAQNNNLSMADLILGYSYTLGTEISRTMKRYADLYAKGRGMEDLQARKEVAKIVIKMLPDIREELAHYETKTFKARTFVGILAKHTVLKTEEECGFLAALVKNAEPFMSSISVQCQNEGEQWRLEILEASPATLPSVEFK